MLQRDRTRRLPARKRWRQSATVFAVLPLSGCGATVEVSNIKVLFDSAGPASGHGLASVARRHSDPHDRFLLAPNTVFPLPILRAAAATYLLHLDLFPLGYAPILKFLMRQSAVCPPPQLFSSYDEAHFLRSGQSIRRRHKQ